MPVAEIELQQGTRVGNTNELTGIVGSAITSEQRKRLGIEQYYRPFTVNKKTVLTNHRGFGR